MKTDRTTPHLNLNLYTSDIMVYLDMVINNI